MSGAFLCLVKLMRSCLKQHKNKHSASLIHRFRSKIIIYQQIPAATTEINTIQQKLSFAAKNTEQFFANEFVCTVISERYKQRE